MSKTMSKNLASKNFTSKRIALLSAVAFGALAVTGSMLAAVKAAGLVDTLEGKGPFTVFAPTNMAFGKLPQGTVDTLVKPENKATLTKILTYHVVPGKLEASSLTEGKKLKTAEGEELTVKHQDGKVWIVDAKGGTSMVTIANVNQSNGVIHVVDTVLMPAS